MGCGGQGSGCKSSREFHTHIYLDYARIKILPCKKKKKFKYKIGYNFRYQPYLIYIYWGEFW